MDSSEGLWANNEILVCERLDSNLCKLDRKQPFELMNEFINKKDHENSKNEQLIFKLTSQSYYT